MADYAQSPEAVALELTKMIYAKEQNRPDIGQASTATRALLLDIYADAVFLVRTGKIREPHAN